MNAEYVSVQLEYKPSAEAMVLVYEDGSRLESYTTHNKNGRRRSRYYVDGVRVKAVGYWKIRRVLDKQANIPQITVSGGPEWKPTDAKP